MRQTAVMTKTLLLPFFTLLLLSNVIHAQIDQDGANIGMIECLNADQPQFEQDVEDFLTNFSFTDSDNSDCAGAISFIAIDNWNSSFPYTCDIDQVDLDIELECDGSPFTINVLLDVTDGTVPNWPSLPSDPAPFECDGAFNIADIDAWVASVVADAQNGDADDNCSASADLIVNNDWDSSNPTANFTQDCSDFVGEIIITFNIEDECGNFSPDEQFTITIEDTTNPVWNLSSGALDFTESPCDASNGTDHELAFQNWVANIEATVVANGEVVDDCTDPSAIVVTADVTSTSINFEDCVADPFIHEQVVVFTATDACGLTSDFQATWQLEDTTPPVLADPNGIQTTPAPECDDLASIQSEVETILLSGILTDDCTDLSNLAIGDFTITPDPASVTSADFTPGNNTCYIIPFEIVYTDPCGVDSNTEMLFFDVDDTTPPDMTGILPWDDFNPLQIGPYCLDEIGSDIDVLDIVLPGGWDFSPATENCTDLDDIVPILIGGNIGDFCGDLAFMEWQFEDECGNRDPVVYRVEWDIAIGGPTYTPLDWVGGDPTAFFPPGDITISYDDADCTNDNMPCQWLSDTDPDNPGDPTMWDWMALENMQWEGGCEVSVIYSHVPCAAALSMVNQDTPPELLDAFTNAETTTTVSIEIIDECDPSGSLYYDFDVTIRCLTCGLDGGIFCPTCEDADENCKLCDPDELASGYTSCTPPCGGPGEPPCTPPAGEQPSPLCMASGVPNNMSWFAFVASSESLALEVDVGQCTNGDGVQAGIYDSCDWDNCIIFFPGGGSNCFSTSSTESSNSFVPGNTYYLWVDGCGGDECEYTVTVVGLEFLGLPEMDAVTAYSPCRELLLTDNPDDPNYTGSQISPDGSNSVCGANNAVTVCPGEPIQFGIIHKGNPSNPIDIHQTECNEYTDVLSADFVWNVEWDGQVISNPATDGEFIPELMAPDVPGVYKVCLDFINYECDIKTGPACLDVHVEPIQNETYIHDVCVEDLDQIDGWDPTLSPLDPNGDGLEWLGVSVTLDEVDDWTLSTNGDTEGYRCMQFLHEDPDCECEVPQTMCIKVVGDRDKTPVELFMYRCQFLECNTPYVVNGEVECDPVVYEWTWNWNDSDEIAELFNEDDVNYTQDMCFTIDGYHEQLDSWRPQGNEFCDTIPRVTVRTIDPLILITDLGCGSYSAELDFDAMDEDQTYDFFPEIFTASPVVEFIDCSTGNSLGGANGTIQLPGPNPNVCVRISYSFDDGAWWDPVEEEYTHGSGQPQTASCSTIWGPYDWGEGMPPPPTFTGDDTFCATDLDNHLFEITNPAPGFSYVWNENPEVPGVTVTDVSVAGDGSRVEISLPSGWGPNDCTNVIARASCGDSEPPTQVCFTLLEPPTVVVDPIADICITGAPDASADSQAEVTATAMPAGANYCYTWSNAGSSTTTTTNMTTYNFASSGTQMVTVSVEDKDSGCSSVVSAPMSFEVIDPLPAPAISCGDQGQTELEITWMTVPEATGYTVFVNGTPVVPDFGPNDNSYTESGLTLGTTVNFTVMALGSEPCRNSPQSAPTPCTTSDCAPASVTQDIQGMTFCENDAPGVIDLDAGFPFTEPTGMLTYVSTPAGLVTGGMFDTGTLTEGVYDIQVTFSFDQLCPDRVFNLQYIVTGVPDPSFEIESPICVNNTAAIIDLPEGNVTWDFGSPDATQDVNGNIKWDAADTYTVKAVSNEGGCLDSTTFDVVVEPALEDIVNEGCDSGLDFIQANWSDVTGALGYDLVITNENTGVTTTETAWPDSEYMVSGLNENDEVTIQITAISAIPGCESTLTIPCTATACEQYPPLSFLPCVEGDGFVTFAWNPINGITDFVVINLDDGLEINQTELEITIDGLVPLQEVMLSVQPVHPTAGCEIPASMFACEAPCPNIPQMSDVSCTDSSIDFVFFDWDDVNDIDGYEVTWSINGGTETTDTIQNSELGFPGELWPTDLDAEDEVSISVVALNPDQLCGNDDPMPASCVASACTQPVFTDPNLEFCWDPAVDGPLQLTIGDVVDVNGDPLSGNVEWITASVDPVTGLFTPTNTTESNDYTIRFEWSDRDFPDDCQFRENIIVQVYIKPTPMIDPNIDEVCVGDPVVLMGADPDDAAVVVTIDETTIADEGGAITFGTWPSQLEITYDSPGIKTFRITHTSDADIPCATDASVTYEVIPVDMLNVYCVAVSNNSVTFGWDPFPGALGYNYSVDGGPSTLTADTEITIDGLTSDDPVVIDVTGFFDPPRPCDVVGTATCTPGDCPPGTWTTVGTGQDLGAFCPEELESLALSVPGAEALTGGPNEQNPPFTIDSESWTGHPLIDEATGEFIYDAAEVNPGEEITISYSVDFISPDGAGDICPYTTTYSFSIYESPFLVLEPEDVDCLLDEVPSIELIGSGGTEPYTYQWDNSPPETVDPTFVISSPGTYDMIITDANGCTFIQSVNIEGAPDPQVVINGPSSIFNGETEEFEYMLDDLTVPVNSVVWYIDDIPLDLQPDQDILEILGSADELGTDFELKVDVYFSDDCFIKDSLRVDIFDVERWYIPNVISTGADGDDSEWSMYTKGNVIVEKLSIYDRWGELVHIKNLDPLVDVVDVQGTDATGQRWDLSWGGTWGDVGANVEQGVYVFVIDLIVDGRPEVEAGDITIFR